MIPMGSEVTHIPKAVTSNIPWKSMVGPLEVGWTNFQALVGGLEHEVYDFPYIGNVIIPTDSYFSEGLKPPTILDFQANLQYDLSNSIVDGRNGGWKA
jgi:hypothetical protein